MPIDKLARPLGTLRISVTDRCNLRCSYCMPREVFGPGYTFLERHKLLTFGEIFRLAGCFVNLGVRRIRITGGEPLLRRDLHKLIARLSAIPRLTDLAMTTNGLMLAEQAAELKRAGLRRITVSLDALDENGFQSVSGSQASVEQVFAGIEAAKTAGFSPLKVNCVLKKGANEASILPLARHFHGSGQILRFIEYMDVGNSNGWKLNEVVFAREIVETIHREMPLEPIAPANAGDVARRWRYRDGGGEIGVIAAVSAPFCRDCNRARLSPEGKLYTCLFGSEGVDLRSVLRGGVTDRDLESVLEQIWGRREDRYSEIRTSQTSNWPKVEMSYIGG